VKSSTGDVTVQKSCKAFHKSLSENLKASLGDNAPVRDCGKRFPNDLSNLDQTEFVGLDNLCVVLEVWGCVG